MEAERTCRVDVARRSGGAARPGSPFPAQHAPPPEQKEQLLVSRAGLLLHRVSNPRNRICSGNPALCWPHAQSTGPDPAVRAVSGNRPQGGDGDVCLSVHSNRLFRDAPGPSLTATPRGRGRSVPTVPVPVTRGSASRLQPRARFHLPRGQSCVGGQLRPLTHARAAAETGRPAKPGLVTTRLSREYSASQSVPGPDRRPGSRFALRLSCFEL